MNDLSLPGHEAKVENKPTTKYGYGDMPYSSSEPYLVCSCGFKIQLYNSQKFEIERLEHFVTVLSAYAY